MKRRTKFLGLLTRHALLLCGVFVAGLCVTSLASCNQNAEESSSSKGDDTSLSGSTSKDPVIPSNLPLADISDFTMDYYPKERGYVIGDYQGNLTRFRIPDEVTVEGETSPIVGLSDNAFYGRKHVKCVVLGDNVRFIGKDAFYGSGLEDLYGCSSLKTLTGGLASFATTDYKPTPQQGVYYLPSLNNPYCVALSYVKGETPILNPTCEAVADNCFDSYEDAIPLPSNIKTIGDCSWSWDYEANGPLPEKLTLKAVGSYGLKNCTKLRSITLLDGTIIGNGAFYGCKALQSIALPSAVTSIGKDAFAVCTSFRDAYVSVSSIRDFTSMVGKDNVRGAVHLLDKDGKEMTSVEVPSSVITIVDAAFFNCHSLKSIFIPDSVTSIDAYAFSGCTSLESMVIPSSVTSIGKNAFLNCTSLASIELGDSLATIGAYAFSGCSALKSIAIPASVTSIGEYAFYYCASLMSLEIPDSVSIIAPGAFRECVGLTDFVVGPNVTSIGDLAFIGCSTLQTITVGGSVTSIGKKAFSGCSDLEAIAIPASVTSIGEAAFKNCPSLVSIEIPDSVTSIGDSAFYECSALKRVKIGDSVTSIPGLAFCDCESLTSVKMGDSLTAIEDYAFIGCASLSTIVIPKSVTTISDFAFTDSGLKTIYVESDHIEGKWSKNLPEGCVVIYNYASN